MPLNRFDIAPTGNTRMMSPRDREMWAPRISFEQFQKIFYWRQGQHVAMIGPNGSGKTTLALYLIDLRQYVAAFVTKPRDSVMENLLKKGSGYKRLFKWKDYDPNIVPKRLIWPDARQLGSEPQQKLQFEIALKNIYIQGGWTVYIDELYFVSEVLGLAVPVRTFLTQARSLDISMLVTTQRPARVPVEIFDQSTHLFFWQENDERNLKTLGGISWANASTVMDLIAHLDPHECLYVNVRHGATSMVRFTAPERI